MGGRGGVSGRGGVIVAVLAACASPAREDPWPAPEAGSEVVGYLDGKPIALQEVARYLRSRDPEAFSRNLEAYLLSRLAREEAGALGIGVAPAALRQATERRIAEWEARVRAASRQQGGEEIAPELWLERVSGLSMARFREEVARHTEAELLEDRLLRYEQRISPSVEVSILVVEGIAKAESALARLRGGEPFVAVAKDLSVHESASGGGRIDFRLLAADLSDSAVREALFGPGARAGQTPGPFAAPSAKGEFQQIYRIEALHAADGRPYAAHEESILRDLGKRPVSVAEYERWRRRILLRHGFTAAPPPRE